MSAQPADQHVDDTSLDAEITALIGDLLEEHEGFERAALRALARSYLFLLAERERLTFDADRSCSRGFLREASFRKARGRRTKRDGAAMPYSLTVPASRFRPVRGAGPSLAIQVVLVDSVDRILHVYPRREAEW